MFVMIQNLFYRTTTCSSLLTIFSVTFTSSKSTRLPNYPPLLSISPSGVKTPTISFILNLHTNPLSALESVVVCVLVFI